MFGLHSTQQQQLSTAVIWLGQGTVNSEADINEMKLQTVTLDYMHASIPLNPSYIWRQFKSSVGMADSATKTENYYVVR